MFYTYYSFRNSSIMSHEFKLHHLTSQLIQLLQLQHISSDAYKDTPLTSHDTIQIGAHTALTNIAEHSSKREEFYNNVAV